MKIKELCNFSQMIQDVLSEDYVIMFIHDNLVALLNLKDISVSNDQDRHNLE